MTPSEVFLCTIAENLYDNTPRLIFADWLEEHGDSERAEFIRVQCELEPIRDKYAIDRAAELHRREEQLLHEHQKEWLGPVLQDWNEWSGEGASAEFRRGFVDTISMPVRTFLDQRIGLRSGFIRIQDCQFPHDNPDYQYNRPYWSVFAMQGEEEEFGLPDRDGEGIWVEYPRGYAGMFARRLRDQEYVFGWDRYADKRGRVHST